MIRFLQSSNKTAKYLLGGLMLIMCGSMCLYLIPGFMGGSTITTNGVVASVGGEEISTDSLQRAVGQIQQRQKLQGQEFPAGLLPYLRQQALQQLIQAAEIRYEGDRMGLKVSDQELQDFLHKGEFGQIFYPKGAFIGIDRYQQLVQENWDTTTDEFEKEVRMELLANKLLSAVSASAMVSESEIEQAYKQQNTKVKFDYAFLKLENVEKGINPTDAELKAFYDNNKNRYQNSIPEKRQVRYFVIPIKQVESQVTVAPSEVESYYHDHQSDYVAPERVKVRHILIKTPPPGTDGKVDQAGVDAARAKATDILKQIKSGADFAELAKKNSDDPGTKDKGGELGWITRPSGLVPEFEQAAFSLYKGQTSDLVQSPTYGFFIIQAEDKELTHTKPLAEVKDSIEQNKRQQKVSDLLETMSNNAEEEAKRDGLDKAAAKYGDSVVETNPVAMTDSLAGVGVSKDLMNAIFAVDEKTGAQSIHIPQGDVVFQVQKIIPPSTPTLEQIKDKVTTDFKSERASTLLTQKTAELSDRAHSEHDLQKAAKELGATVKSSDLVGHTGQVPDIGSMGGAANAAFELKQGEISGPLNGGNVGFVLKVTELQEASVTGDEFAKAKDGIRDRLLGQKRQEAEQLFLSNLSERLEKEGKIKVNKNEMDAQGRGGRG